MQTPELHYYEVNITWGDMQFVYDRGRYNAQSGNLERASSLEGVEVGANDNDINKWYGFNGVNNKITIQNMSTKGIKAVASTSVSTSQNDIGLQLYFKDGQQWVNEDSASNVANNFKVSHDSGYTMKTYGPGKNISNTISAAKVDPNGNKTNISSKEFFLNVTGGPQEGFSESELPESMSTIGRISINLYAL